MTDFAVVAQSCGAVYYTPPPLRAVRGLSFTFEQLDAFVGRVLKLNAEAAVSEAVPPAKLWLWMNFVDGRPEYWAFDNPYPINLDDGDPQTLGEPCGYAIFKPSRTGRTDVSEEQVLRAIARAASPPVPQPVATVREMSLGLPWLQWLSDEVALATPAGTLLFAAPSPAPQPLTGKLVPEAFWISFCEFIRDWQGGDFELPELARLDVQACLAALEPRPGIALDGASPVLARTVPLAVAVEAAQAAVQAAIAKGRTHAEIRWGDLNALIAGTSPTPPNPSPTETLPCILGYAKLCKKCESDGECYAATPPQEKTQ